MASVKGGARRWWLRVHRWTALSLGLPLALVALLGSVLIVARPLDRLLHPELFQAGPGAPSPCMLEAARHALATEFPQAALTLRPPRELDETLQVLVRGDWRGTVWFDPVTLQERGRRGEHEGFVNAVFELHSSLLMDDSGKALLAGIALAYVALLVTGVVLWWPTRWSQSLRIVLDRGALRGWLDVHRTVGAVLGLTAAVSIGSGAYMAWRPLSQTVSRIAGVQPVQPPRVQASSTSGHTPLTMDELVQISQHQFSLGSEGYVGYVQWTGRHKPVRVRLKLPDDPHPNGLTSVWLHPVSGEALARHRWNTLDPGARGFSVVYPLHTGELGGVVHQSMNAILGLSIFGLSVSGTWLWNERRRRTSAQRDPR